MCSDTSFASQLRYLGPYLTPYRKVIALSLFLSVLSTTLGMIQPYFSKILIDRVLMGGHGRLLFILLGVMIGLLIIGFAVRVGNSYLYTRYSARLLFAMRENMFQHLHHIPLKFFTRRKIGDLYSRIGSDMADLQAFLTDLVPHFLFNFLTCLITAAILLALNWRMALMSFAILPAGLFVIRRIRPRILHLSKSVAETNADVAQLLFESLGNTHLVRAFGARKAENRRLSEKHDGLLAFLLGYQVMGAVSGAVPTLFIIFNTLVVFGYGGLLVLDGKMTVGGLVAFSIYQGRVFSPLQGLLDGFLSMQKSRVAFARIREILDIPAEPAHDEAVFPTADEALSGGIRFSSVSFAYEPGEPVLEAATFTIPEGRITALVGPSGAGKTTICHLCMRILTPDAGQILLGGRDLQQIAARQLRSTVCMVSQDIFLFHTSILENIRFGNPDADAAAVARAASAACIDDFIRSLPAGYDTPVGDRGAVLSGGQKQRICIARAILMDPKILILDEATAFLDAAVEDRLKETVRRLMKGRTIIIVSHRERSLVDADHIIALQKTAAAPGDSSPAARGAGSTAARIVYDGPRDGYRP
jgi:ABC-type multidrug transport system fused ATPase/permease subunit